jgi:hypothetical protein
MMLHKAPLIEVAGDAIIPWSRMILHLTHSIQNVLLGEVSVKVRQSREPSVFCNRSPLVGALAVASLVYCKAGEMVTTDLELGQ